MSDNNIAYICNRKACGDKCPSPELCSHTTNIEYAINFIKHGDKYIERDLVDLLDNAIGVDLQISI